MMTLTLPHTQAPTTLARRPEPDPLTQLKPRQRRALATHRFPQERYRALRNLGVTHREALDAHLARVCLDTYADARQAGVTHRQFRSARQAGISFAQYIAGRQAGLSHGDLLAAWAYRPYPETLAAYTQLRISGIPHSHVTAAIHRKSDTQRYIAARATGADHATALARSRA